MADAVEDLFLFGDDFDAILDILEEDVALEEQFTSVASDVESTDIVCSECGKKCKSKGGLKRHQGAKHGQNQNISKPPDQDQTFTLTPTIFTEIVRNAVQSVKENDVFAVSLRKEFYRYEVKQLEEETSEFAVMKTLYESFLKNGNTEKFYGNYYAQVPLTSTIFFPGLSRNAATLLATKVAASMLSFCNHLKSTDKSQQGQQSNNVREQLSEKEKAGLQYVGGYVLHKLHKNYARKSTTENQQAMAILKAGKLEEDFQSQKLVSSLNRGGLWYISKPAQNIFSCTEHYFRKITSVSNLHKIDMSGITQRAIKDSEVISSYQSMVSDAELVPNGSVSKDVFYGIITLYVRVRSFSFAKEFIQRYKVKVKQAKTKVLFS